MSCEPILFIKRLHKYTESNLHWIEEKIYTLCHSAFLCTKYNFG